MKTIIIQNSFQVKVQIIVILQLSSVKTSYHFIKMLWVPELPEKHPFK